MGACHTGAAPLLTTAWPEGKAGVEINPAASTALLAWDAWECSSTPARGERDPPVQPGGSFLGDQPGERCFNKKICLLCEARHFITNEKQKAGSCAAHGGGSTSFPVVPARKVVENTQLCQKAPSIPSPSSPVTRGSSPAANSSLLRILAPGWGRGHAEPLPAACPTSLSPGSCEG